MKNLNISAIFFLVIFAGCAQSVEVSKTIWGSSTRSLKAARSNAIVRTYDAPLGRCYDEMLAIIKEEEYQLFINNKAKAEIVIMGIKGSVNTTEVGIFFSDISDTETKIYISSLSSNAKRIVAEKVFSQFDEIFGKTANQTTTTINESN